VAAEAELCAAFADNDEVLAVLDLGLRRWGIFIAARERAKTTIVIVIVIHEIRLAMLELGRRMVARSVIAGVGGVFGPPPRAQARPCGAHRTAGPVHREQGGSSPVSVGVKYR